MALFDRFADVRWLYLCLFLISLSYVTLLYSVDSGAGTYEATYRYSPVSWSTDNQIAQIIAEEMVSGTHCSFLEVFAVEDGKYPTDRQLTGMFLTRPAFGILLPFGETRHPELLLLPNCRSDCDELLDPPFWVLCRKLGLDLSGSMLTMLLVGMSSFVVFNSLYIWPKMNAGALGLDVYLLLVADPSVNQTKPSLRRAFLAGCDQVRKSPANGGLGVLLHNSIFWNVEFWLARSALQLD